MPSKAVESKKARYPQQHVREGRGTPGYSGNVDVYPTVNRSKAMAQRAQANAAGDIPPATPSTPLLSQEPEKLDAGRMTRDTLESIALQRGLTAAQINEAETKADLIAAIEAKV